MAKVAIKAPIPGTFYRSSSPDIAAFKADGDAVAAGDTICLIEVMKTFQEIKAGVDGTSITFLVDNEDPIMAGQVIAEVEQ